MKKRVCILYTGGTIGMVATDHGYAPLQGHLQRVLNAMPELRASDITAVEWNQMGASIRDHYGSYDGFVVLHGTDTMAYTASALAFMLEGLGKPVVLTGSQIPIGQLRSDARDRNLPYTTLSPTFTGTGTRLPSLSSLPSPTARTVPLWGFSFASVARNRPEAVVSSASSCLTITRSPRGFKFITLPSFRPTYARTRLSHVRYLTTQQW